MATKHNGPCAGQGCQVCEMYSIFKSKIVNTLEPVAPVKQVVSIPPPVVVKPKMTIEEIAQKRRH